MIGPTPRQLQALEFIATSIRERGFAPTLRDIGHAMGIRSTNGVNDHLRSLERKGLMERVDMLSRTMTITDAGWRELGADRCPHCGALTPAQEKSEVA